VPLVGAWVWACALRLCFGDPPKKIAYLACIFQHQVDTKNKKTQRIRVPLFKPSSARYIPPNGNQTARFAGTYMPGHALAGGGEVRPLTPSARFGVGGARSSARSHGKVLLGVRWRGQEARGRAAKSSSARVGVGEGAKCGEVCSPTTCEVIFGARQRLRARRRTIFSPARCSARVGVDEGAGA